MQFYSAVLVALAAPFVAGLNISTNDTADLSLAVKQVANGVLSFYDGDEPGNSPGTFPDPYYFWEYAVAWDSLVNYWYLTGDATHNVAVQAALDHQLGPNDDYMPLNQTAKLMNDDEAVWGLAAMTAAERGFPLADDSEPAYVERARNVFDNMAGRWDTATCGGGLRWAIFAFNNGYSYKDTATQAFFFQLAARLARFTGNETYIDWATRSYDWTRDVGLIDADNFNVYGGTPTGGNCSVTDHTQWSLYGASFAYGSAIMANITSNSTWATRASSHLANTLHLFFPATTPVLQEVACEPKSTCNVDQLVFPALTLRWLALLPVFNSTTNDGSALATALDSTAVAAASRCTTADDDAAVAECTNGWSEDDAYEDGKVKRTKGLGQQLAALEALLARYVRGVADE
ncbi:hydrolase 76 protein [Diplodia intermedia]|uniref:Mannan endo-1,6-alpha-mannosidase n=1 Tax=Diplodia intermedia TaxID=856260 RepID=A0ABR3TK85_9PEZI